MRQQLAETRVFRFEGVFLETLVVTRHDHARVRAAFRHHNRKQSRHGRHQNDRMLGILAAASTAAIAWQYGFEHQNLRDGGRASWGDNTAVIDNSLCWRDSARSDGTLPRRQTCPFDEVRNRSALHSKQPRLAIRHREKPMCAAYLRLQGDRCQRLSRSCMDLGAARDLRLMAEEYFAEASRLDAVVLPLKPD